MKSYQIDLRIHLKLLAQSFFYLVGTILVFLFGMNQSGLSFFDSRSFTLEAMSFIFAAIMVGPALVIHTMYYIHQKGRALEINKDNQTITFIFQCKSELYHFADIKEIIVYKRLLDLIGIFPIGQYFYTEMNFSNGSTKIITCLLVDHLEDLPFITKKVNDFFPAFTASKL